jgi:release factor glutamine methyltransferase
LPELVVSVADALRDATDRLTRAGCDTPRLDAELLLAAAFGCDRAQLFMRDPAPPPPGFEALLERRAAREPVAYILGSKEFRRISLSVDHRVLVPRPETELLVEVGVSRLRRGARVVDVGTGSGAVALALKDERPDLEVMGTDVSPDALEVARGNAVRLGFEVEFVLGDLLAGLSCDAVIANLPYVEAGAELPPELSYEPAGSLFAGRDGLEVIRRLISGLPDAVSSLALELDPRQVKTVTRLLRGAGFGSVEVLQDLAGFDRVVVGTR